MGLSSLFTAALDSNESIALFLRASVLAILVALAFFTLESGASHLFATQLPEASTLNFVQVILMAVLLLAFGAVVFIQMLLPVLKTKLTARW